MTVRPWLLAAVGVAWAHALPAQSMRPFTTYRQLHGETRLTAKLDFAAGRLRVLPGRETDLYRMTLAYDGERFAPISAYDAAMSAVALGVETVGGAGLRVVSGEQIRQLAAVELSPHADLTLDVSLGASEADLELGGLRLSELHLDTGASRTAVRFSRPNGIRCTEADITTGAAEVTVAGLGNSRCDRVRLEGGISRATIDFGGSWASSQRAEIAMAVGELVLRLPRAIPVRITTDRFLASFEPKGLVRRGDAWETPGYAAGARHLDVALKATVGGVRLEWIN